MFIDEATIFLKAGKGGDGCVSFRRERFIPKGGPDGGDGGSGGSIYFQADTQIRTLTEYYRNPHRKAENGQNGSGGKKNGKKGCDLFLKVPIGTIIEDKNINKIIADLSRPGEQVCVAKGGLGGKGNYHFKSSIQRSPKFAQKGEYGEEKTIKLNLKLIADAALIGLPNVGKSTLLSKISAAKPKIANYPFTTLEPKLGVVCVDEENQFVLADIPGLIEGAWKGAGLGIRFLKHIERTKILVHIIDGSNSSVNKIIEDYYTIKNELNQYSFLLKNKRELIVINKCDLPEVQQKIEEIRDVFCKKGKEVIFISAITGKGVSELIQLISTAIKFNEKEKVFSRIDYQNTVAGYEYKPPFVIKKEEDYFVVEGEKIEKLVYQFDLDNPQALRYFQNKIKNMGLEKALKKEGVQEGDLVKIGEKEFYFFIE